MADDRFATFAGRQRNVTLVWGEIAAQIALRSTAEWLGLLEEEDIPFAPVQSLEDLRRDPHLDKVDFWRIVDDPAEGALRFPANPLDLSASPPSIRRIPPRLGEHTEEILAELGHAAEPAHDGGGERS